MWRAVIVCVLKEKEKLTLILLKYFMYSFKKKKKNNNSTSNCFSHISLLYFFTDISYQSFITFLISVTLIEKQMCNFVQYIFIFVSLHKLWLIFFSALISAPFIVVFIESNDLQTIWVIFLVLISFLSLISKCSFTILFPWLFNQPRPNQATMPP